MNIIWRGRSFSFARRSVQDFKPFRFFGATSHGHSHSHDNGHHGDGDHSHETHDDGHHHGPHIPVVYDRIGKAILISCYLWVLFRFKENNGQIFVSVLFFLLEPA